MNEIWTNFIYPFVSLFALGFIYYTLKSLLPSYFSEKGKNIATKEDISEITEKVEEVKLEFTKQTEQLKSKLNVISNVHVDLVTQERNAIIDCYVAYSTWLNVLTDINIGGIESSNDENLLEFRQKLQQNYKNFQVNQAKFNLFIEDGELKQLLNDLTIATITNLSILLPKFTLGLEGINDEKKTLKETIPDYTPADYQKILDKHKNLLDEFAKNIIVGYKEISDLHKKFQKDCREKIYELIKNEK